MASKYKRIGWVGFCDGRPEWWGTTDDYTDIGDNEFYASNLFRSRKDALKRFMDVREVFVPYNSHTKKKER